MKVILNVTMWKYINDQNCDYITLPWSGNPSTTLLVAKKFHWAQQSEIKQICESW